MGESIAIFGPAQVGKSTLFGYVKATVEGRNIDKHEEKLIKDLGTYYEKEKVYAYISDTAMDERLKKTSQDSSSYMHTGRVQIGNIEYTIIDTPGAEHFSKERIKGMSYGDVGIFMIELAKCEKDYPLKIEDYSANFSNLFIWFKFRENKNLIVLLSKADTRDFSEDSFYKAQENIKRICKDNFDRIIEIIPVAIEVDKRIEHNVFTNSPKMLWYKGPTLMQALNRLQLPEKEKGNNLFAYADTIFKLPNNLRLLRTKLLQGRIEKGQDIIMAPIKYQNQIYPFLTAKVKEIGKEKGELAESAENGDIVRLNLTNTRINDKRCNFHEKDLELLGTTCVVEPTTPLVTGNILFFEDTEKTFGKMNTKANLNILWFGRLIEGKILKIIKSTEKHPIVVIELLYGPAVLPLNRDNKVEFRDFLIMKPKQEFIPVSPVSLLRMGIPDNIVIRSNKINLNSASIVNFFKKFEYEASENELKIYCNESFIPVMLRIQDLLKDDIGKLIIADFLDSLVGETLMKEREWDVFSKRTKDVFSEIDYSINIKINIVNQNK